MSGTGFTLLEVMAALVATGLVALVAYGVASTGFDTRERLEQHRSTLEAQAVVRALLTGALRHPPAEGGANMNEALFALDDVVTDPGLPADRVRFVSHGVVSPLGTPDRWTVSLAPTDRGLRVRAVPASAVGPELDLLLAEARGLEVRVLDRTPDAEWASRWEVLGRAPAAVRLTLLAGNGEPIGAPLLVRAGLEELP